MNNLIDYIFQFISLQSKLLLKFRHDYPDCEDYEYLLDFPKKGKIQVDDAEWEFFRHGAGLLFRSVHDGREIDARRKISSPDSFDFSRIEQYLESIGVDTTEALEQSFRDAINAGEITVQDETFQLLMLADKKLY